MKTYRPSHTRGCACCALRSRAEVRNSRSARRIWFAVARGVLCTMLGALCLVVAAAPCHAASSGEGGLAEAPAPARKDAGALYAVQCQPAPSLRQCVDLDISGEGDEAAPCCFPLNENSHQIMAHVASQCRQQLEAGAPCAVEILLPEFVRSCAWRPAYAPSLPCLDESTPPRATPAPALAGEAAAACGVCAAPVVVRLAGSAESAGPTYLLRAKTKGDRFVVNYAFIAPAGEVESLSYQCAAPLLNADVLILARGSGEADGPGGGQACFYGLGDAAR